jgi:hypothetical protein
VDEIIQIGASLLPFVFMGALSLVLFAKVGWRPWLGFVLGFIPGVNVVTFLVFVARDWPIETEARRWRLMQGRASASDVSRLMSYAIRCERLGQTDEAERLYRDVMEKCPDIERQKDARISLESLQKKMGREHPAGGDAQ